MVELPGRLSRRHFVVALGGSAATALVPEYVRAASKPAAPAPPALSSSAIQTQPLTPQQFAAKMQSIVSSFASLRNTAKIIMAQYQGHLHTYTLGQFGMTTLALGSEGNVPVTLLDSEMTERSTGILKAPPALAIGASVSSISGSTLDALYPYLPKLEADANAIDSGFGAIRAAYELHTHTVQDHQQNLYRKPIYGKSYPLASSNNLYSVATERPAVVAVPPSAKATPTYPPLYQKSTQELFLDALGDKIVALEAESRALAQSVAEHHHPYTANNFVDVPIKYNGFTLRVLTALGPHTVVTTGVVIA